MATLPTDGYPRWASKLMLTPVTSEPNKEKPTTVLQDAGLTAGETLLRKHVNWQLDSIARWIEHQDSALLEISIRLDALDGKGVKDVNVNATTGIGELYSTVELSANIELHS